jgi:hypothetical protein
MAKIKTIEKIIDLANNKKCVVVKQGRTGKEVRIPAAIVQNYPAQYLLRILKVGFISEYKLKNGIQKNKRS